MIWYYQFPKEGVWYNTYGWKIMYWRYVSKEEHANIYIKPMSNINNITCGCEKRISAMLLQSDINKLRLSKISKLDKLYIDYASTRLL